MIPNITFVFRPDEVSTLKGDLDYCLSGCNKPETVPLTLADLGGSCLTRTRETRDTYNDFNGCYPYLVLPPSVFEKIDTSWSMCSFYTYSIWDPPRALTQVSSLKVTTTPSGHQSGTTPAAPGLSSSVPAISTIRVSTGDPPLALVPTVSKTDLATSARFDLVIKSSAAGGPNQAPMPASTHSLLASDCSVPLKPSFQTPDLLNAPENQHTIRSSLLEVSGPPRPTATATPLTSNPLVRSPNNPAADLSSTETAKGTVSRPF